jgi:hypothetical protein
MFGELVMNMKKVGLAEIKTPSGGTQEDKHET